MTTELSKDILYELENSAADAEKLLQDLCAIPAPSHFEDERAAFVKKTLENFGAEGVYIDEAKNVVFPLHCEEKNDIICFAAHTDTVFPADTPLSFRQDGDTLYCPGIGDDTANLVNMLMIVRCILRRGLTPTRGVLFVANACEEGLGNLKGTRRIFRDYAGRIDRFITFDGGYHTVMCKSVGSHRYRIEAATGGGHSWSAFGAPNAIVELSRLIGKLCDIPLPEKAGTKTTFNVGSIEGGTSVNTIAQNASMLCEYRSDDAETLAVMKQRFDDAVAAFRKDTDANITVTAVGERPCGQADDRAAQEQMIRRCAEISERYTGTPCARRSGSTDCNIPLSLGIPAVCIGLIHGGNAHTREEWISRKSISVGLKIAARIILDHFKATS